MLTAAAVPCTHRRFLFGRFVGEALITCRGAYPNAFLKFADQLNKPGNQLQVPNANAWNAITIITTLM